MFRGPLRPFVLLALLALCILALLTPWGLEAGERTKKVILDATVNNREKDGIEYVSLRSALVCETVELMLMIVNGSIAVLLLIKGLGVGYRLSWPKRGRGGRSLSLSLAVVVSLSPRRTIRCLSTRAGWEGSSGR
jgi:hypothetical protein